MYEYSYKKKSRKPVKGNPVLGPVLKFGRDFCLFTSMHGFNHIAVKGRLWFERILWVLITAAAIWGAIDISLGQLQRYNDNPTVVALEKDFRSWSYSLPAITACSVNRVNPKKLPEVIKNLWNLEPVEEKYPYYANFVTTVANSDLFHLEGFTPYKDDETLNVDLFQLAVDVLPEFQVKASWSESSNMKWLPIMTESGACYVTNCLAISDAVIGKPNINDTKDIPLTCKYSSLNHIILEVTPATDFYAHSPYDVIDIASPPSRVMKTLNRAIELSVTETRAGRGVKELSPQRRGCLYTDEPTQQGRKVFSTNTCRLSCRSRLAIKLCGCKPFYYFYEEGPQCTPAGMSCLSSYKTQLGNNAGARCVCSQQCIDCHYREITTEDQYWLVGPLAGRGTVRYIVQPPKIRYTREIVFHFQDLIVSFGGAAGLFIGASFISIVEIFYFLLARTLEVCFKEPKLEVAAVRDNKPGLDYESSKIMELTSILGSQKRQNR